MEDKCPECGETLLTKTIQKKIGSGSIDYPIAQNCPKCKWSKDLTGAGDIIAKPVIVDGGAPGKEEAIYARQPVPTAITPKPVKSPAGINTLIPVILAILVLGAIAYVFFINTTQNEHVITAPTPVPTPVVTQTPAQTPTITPTPAVTASGNHTSVRLETDRGFTPKKLIIKPGDEIIWTNEDSYGVTLVSEEGLFPDKFLNNAKRMNHTFLNYTGTFNFYIKEKINLTGTIVVEP